MFVRFCAALPLTLRKGLPFRPATEGFAATPLEAQPQMILVEPDSLRLSAKEAA
jgi:hypothetical protein